MNNLFAKTAALVLAAALLYPTSAVRNVSAAELTPDNLSYSYVDTLQEMENKDFSFDESTGTLYVYTNEGTVSWEKSPSIPDKQSVKYLVISDGVTEIGERAFERCKGLLSAEIPDSVISIQKRAFSLCTSLEHVSIPQGLTSIEEYTFSDCKNLKEVSLPDGLTEINYSAFYNCRSLESVSIPGTVQFIGQDAFSSCKGLTNLQVAEGVMAIGEFAFMNCPSLTDVALPESLAYIDASAFRDCSALKTINLPKNLSFIGNSAFEGSCVLENISVEGVLPAGLGEDVFQNTNHTFTLTVPQGCADTYKTADGWNAYADQIIEAAAC